MRTVLACSCSNLRDCISSVQDALEHTFSAFACNALLAVQILACHRDAPVLHGLHIATLAPAAPVPRPPLQVARLTTVYFESKLMGNKQPGADEKFPYVWSWKKPGFVNPCKTLINKRPASATALLKQYPGYMDVRRGCASACARHIVVCE